MSQRFALIITAAAGSALALAGSAFGQYDTGFEISDGITASPSGTPLTGQDGFYLPSGVDYWAMTYAGNVFGVNANPTGGDQFAAGQGLAGPNYSRGQRDITWPAPQATMEYDVACVYLGVPPATNNLGSFSIQPYPGSASGIHLFEWMDINTASEWKAGYLFYNADGSAMATAVSPGPEWQNLSLNHWYRLQTKIDFTTNQATEASITDLTTMVTTTASLSGVYLQGGSLGGQPAPTGFRLFSGGGGANNVVCFDNVEIKASGGGGYTCTVTGNCPGTVNVAWAGAPASTQQGIVFASNTGSLVVPNGPCQGTQLGLGASNIRLVNTIGTGNGAGNVNGQANSGACGGFLQLVAVGSPCVASTVDQLP